MILINLVSKNGVRINGGPCGVTALNPLITV